MRQSWFGSKQETATLRSGSSSRWTKFRPMMELLEDRTVPVGWSVGDYLINGFNTGNSIGVFDANFAFKGHLDTSVQFPVGLDLRTNGNMVTAGRNAKVIRQYDPAGNLVSSFTHPQVGSAIDVKVGANDHVYIATQIDGTTGGVSEFDLAGNYIRNIGTDDYDGVALLPGNVLWAGGDGQNGRIDVFSTATGLQTGTITLDNGQVNAESMFYSVSTNTVLSTDISTNRIYERTTSGVFVRMFTGGGQSFGVTRGVNGDVVATDTASRVHRWTAAGTYQGFVNVGSNVGTTVGIVWTGIHNLLPTAAADNASVTANEGAVATNTGTYSDANALDNVTFTASVGIVTKTGTNNGTWSWSYSPNDGPAQNQTVTVTANDGKGGVTSVNFNLVVNNVAPTATLANNGPVTEGGTATVFFTLQADASSADAAAGFRYAYDLDNNGLFDDGMGDGTYAGSSSAFFVNLPASLTSDGPGTRTVRAWIIDKDGGHSEYSTAINIVNAAPTATGMTNSGPADEGGSVSVSLTGVSDPSAADAASLRYSFSMLAMKLALDYASANSNNSALFSFGNNGTRTVYGRVYDKDGGISSTFTTTIVYDNVAPTVTGFTVTGGLNADGNGTVGAPIMFQASATDPGLLDAFTYQFDWNYDGTTFNVQDAVGPLARPGGASMSITHAYGAQGSYRPAVRVLDQDGGVSAVFLGPQVGVGNVFIQDGNLIVNGTGSADNISVNAANPAVVTVSRNGTNAGTFNLGGGGRIIIRGGEGNDVISVNGAVRAEIFGGGGNDYLYGGTGADQIWGEGGDDNISLGSGNDVGIGGLGRDLLYGGNNDDILVGGHVDPLAWDWTDLTDASNQWGNYGGSAGTGPAVLAALASQTTDPTGAAEYDRFWGNTGKDAFLYRSGTGGDQVNDYSLSARDYLLALL